MEEKCIVSCNTCGKEFDLLGKEPCDVFPCDVCSEGFCPDCFKKAHGKGNWDMMNDSGYFLCPKCFPRYKLEYFPELTRDKSETLHVCQSMQLTASALLDDLTANPDMLDSPPYRELVDRVYMAARQAATMARILGDDETAGFTDKVCNRLGNAANL